VNARRYAQKTAEHAADAEKRGESIPLRTSVSSPRPLRSESHSPTSRFRTALCLWLLRLPNFFAALVLLTHRGAPFTCRYHRTFRRRAQQGAVARMVYFLGCAGARTGRRSWV